MFSCNEEFIKNINYLITRNKSKLIKNNKYYLLHSKKKFGYNF